MEEEELSIEGQSTAGSMEPVEAHGDDNALISSPGSLTPAAKSKYENVRCGGTLASIVSILLGPMRVPAFAVATNFFITLALFPGVITEIRSYQWDIGSWFVILLVACFNVFDALGRVFLMHPRFVIKSPRINLALSLSRVVFFPLLLYRAAPGAPITSDFLAFLFVAAFAFSNGYVGTLAMMHGPEAVHTEDRERAGSIMAFCLMVGLNAGALVGDAINARVFEGGAGTCVVP